MRNFKEFQVWKDSVKFCKDIYKQTENFPSSEKFSLCSQIQRASVSIPSNIAEGASRDSELDFVRFLQISLGSSFEIETQLIISKDLDYIDELRYNELTDKLLSIQKQLSGLIRKIRS